MLFCSSDQPRFITVTNRVVRHFSDCTVAVGFEFTQCGHNATEIRFLCMLRFHMACTGVIHPFCLSAIVLLIVLHLRFCHFSPRTPRIPCLLLNIALDGSCNILHLGSWFLNDWTVFNLCLLSADVLGHFLNDFYLHLWFIYPTVILGPYPLSLFVLGRVSLTFKPRKLLGHFWSSHLALGCSLNNSHPHFLFFGP